MFGFDDVILVFLLSAAGTLVLEVGAEVFANWAMEEMQNPEVVAQGDQIAGATPASLAPQLEQLHAVVDQTVVSTPKLLTLAEPVLLTF